MAGFGWKWKLAQAILYPRKSWIAWATEVNNQERERYFNELIKLSKQREEEVIAYEATLSDESGTES